MQKESCDLPDHYSHYFNITHSFKVGLSTYHILALRRERPLFRENYYIFECIGHDHDQSIRQPSSLVPLKRSTTQSRTKSIDETRPTQTSASSSNRSQSKKRSDADATSMKDLITQTMKDERRLMLESLRKEMNMKKKTILRTIKKGNKTLLDATNEANKTEQIIRLLEEQKTLLTEASERFISTTTASIEMLKENLFETLNNQQNAFQSMEDVRLKLLKTIEEEVGKIVQKNEQILALTSTQNNSIGRLETTLTEKIDTQSNLNRKDSTEFNRLFTEQKKLLTDFAEQQQKRSPSLDVMRETMVNLLHDQQNIPKRSISEIHSPAAPKASVPTEDFSSPTQISLETPTSSKRRTGPNRSSSATTSQIPSDYHLLKFSVRSSEKAQLYGKLVVDGLEYSRPLHTLCQRDPFQKDVYNCFVAPPTRDGLYQLTIFAKTADDTAFRAAFSIRLPGSHQFQSLTFPLLHQSFYDHNCVLIEPLRRNLRLNEQILIHFLVPDAHKVKIRNGNELFEFDTNELKNDVVKKKIRVRGDVSIVGCWDRKSDSTICVFNTI